MLLLQTREFSMCLTLHSSRMTVLVVFIIGIPSSLQISILNHFCWHTPSCKSLWCSVFCFILDMNALITQLGGYKLDCFDWEFDYYDVLVHSCSLVGDADTTILRKNTWRKTWPISCIFGHLLLLIIFWPTRKIRHALYLSRALTNVSGLDVWPNCWVSIPRRGW